MRYLFFSHLAAGLLVASISMAFGAVALAQSSPAPAFSLPDADGKNVSLDDFKGSIAVVNFWATWCGPCRYEMPAFVRLQNKHRENVRFVGISVDDAGWRAITPFTREIGVNYTILWDEGSKTLGRYGDPSALPATYLIDRDGKLRVFIQGMVSEKDLDEILQMMIRGDQF
jgi:peroxiredoxin